MCVAYTEDIERHFKPSFFFPKRNIYIKQINFMKENITFYFWKLWFVFKSLKMRPHSSLKLNILKYTTSKSEIL